MQRQPSTGRMESTDTMMFALRDGTCVASGWMQAGSKEGDATPIRNARAAARFNADTIGDWTERGLEIRTLPRTDPQAKVLFDQMWDNVETAAQTNSPLTHPRDDGKPYVFNRKVDTRG